MTGKAGPRQDHQDLFVADFYPPLGEYLAARHTAGYAAAAGRARFRPGSTSGSITKQATERVGKRART
jgi:hypothetical protein